MFDSDKYIGIVHHFNKSSFNGCDCIGLVRLFYREHGWSEDFWDNGVPITKKNFNSSDTWKRLIKYLNSHFKSTKDPNVLTEGSIILFVVNGDMHIGIYTGHGMCLSMAVPVKEGISTATLYHKRAWILAFKRGYVK